MKASVDPSLDQIRRLPFVKGLDFSPETRSVDTRTDGILKVHTPNSPWCKSGYVKQNRNVIHRDSA
jgi:hypothetical protein